jgi:hypothetical protein
MRCKRASMAFKLKLSIKYSIPFEAPNEIHHKTFILLHTLELVHVDFVRTFEDVFCVEVLKMGFRKHLNQISLDIILEKRNMKKHFIFLTTYLKLT